VGTYLVKSFSGNVRRMSTKNIVAPKSSLIELELTSEDVGVIKKADGDYLVVYFVGLKKSTRIHKSQLTFLNPAEFGDLFSKKICNVCHKIRKTELFDLNQSGKGDRPVRRPSCKDCRKKIDGVGMTSADKKKWNEIKPNYVEFQCPICKKTTIPPLTSKVVLNHDHETGIPSGWICDSCNTGLGRFKDDIEILKHAIDYLKEANRGRE